MWRSMEAKCRKIEEFCEGKWRPAETAEQMQLQSRSVRVLSEDK